MLTPLAIPSKPRADVSADAARELPKAVPSVFVLSLHDVLSPSSFRPPHRGRKEFSDARTAFGGS